MRQIIIKHPIYFTTIHILWFFPIFQNKLHNNYLHKLLFNKFFYYNYITNIIYINYFLIVLVYNETIESVAPAAKRSKYLINNK